MINNLELEHTAAELDAAKIKILLVDDLSNNLLALEGLLRRPDIEICTANSGSAALDLMIRNDFALALIDVQMPDMSGFELAEFMRGAKKTKNIPIIFVTATANDQSFAFKGYESGAVDFLLKPLDTYAVKSKVNVFVELFKQKQKLHAQLELITGLHADLNSSKIEAERANSFKTQFLANMSHEIRTPLGAILGFLDLLKNPVCTMEEKNNYMVIVERNSQQLLSLINDILDLSKVESGKMSIESIQFSLSDLLAEFIAHIGFKTKEKGIKFIFKIVGLIPSTIRSDPVRLRQILSNIVGNALKFTEKGQIELIVSYDDPTLKFEIKDSGIGISKVQSLKLFQPFTQANSSTTRKFGGTGLGLVLSRRLAEALSGKLELASTSEGFGSTFKVEIKTPLIANAQLVGDKNLPLTQSFATSNQNKSSQALSGLKVLLVEDSPDNQMLITMYLTKAGATVTSASNGAQGVEFALADRYDVILMDIQMPVLDGHEATKKLRHLEYFRPIVALTAHAMKEEREKCFDSGFTDFLTKPLQREVLIDVLSRFVG